MKYFTHTCLHLLFSGVKNSSPKRPARTMLSQLMYTILPASVPSWPKILQRNKSRVTVSQEQLNKIIEIIHAHLDCINCSCKVRADSNHPVRGILENATLQMKAVSPPKPTPSSRTLDATKTFRKHQQS